jgi:transcriptional regulator with GAF, ATPase, and Fis domain
MIASFVQSKLDKVLAVRDNRLARSEVVESIRLASMICTQRSYSELFQNMRNILPQFFGFESVGILLKDQDTGELFTFVETFDNKVIKREKTKKDKYEKIDPASDVVTMKIPCNLGVTGHVYRHPDEVYLC